MGVLEPERQPHARQIHPLRPGRGLPAGRALAPGARWLSILHNQPHLAAGSADLRRGVGLAVVAGRGRFVAWISAAS